MSFHQEITERGNKLFSSRWTLMEHWQDIAYNFYPERADFTVERVLGQEFADHLNTSYPIIIRRELGNAFSGMLRPSNIEWSVPGIEDMDSLSITDRQWLQYVGRRMRTHQYDRHSQFVRATKEGDHDFAAFGQCVVSYEMDWSRMGLLYRCWHLRDVAWDDSYDGTVGEVHRKWKPTVRELKKRYGDKCSPAVTGCKETEQGKRIACRVVTIPSEQYTEGKLLQPWAQIILDCDNETVMEVIGRWTMGYVIPRWQTVSGSQYAYSPATVAGLPDARLIQAITLTLLEAGEIAVRPPLIATKDAIRSDMNYYAGGITIADSAYDERLGDVLRPIAHDNSGLPFGFEMLQDIRGMLSTAFYLNKLTLPPAESKEMTAYETSKRVEEYIRQALPLFEPMENDYNAVMQEDTFEEMMRAGLFGPPQNIPQNLRGKKVNFQFKSPLHDAIDRKMGSQFMETKELLMQAAEIDPTAAADVDIRKAFRQALVGLGTPTDWLRTQDEANRVAAEMMQQRAAEQETAQLAAQGAAVEQAGRGAEAIQAASG